MGFDSDGVDSTVTVHINRIREKIEDDPSNPRIIETVWGEGINLLDKKVYKKFIIYIYFI